ncbi:MAG: transglutaminase-like cysteine peptidase [Methylotenera sp.]|uniref:transglutaminase-like cysteine peptidase n=1 Tax=Methylotenera sp. TaxID=2051956 RepID=UPI0032BE594B
MCFCFTGIFAAGYDFNKLSSLAKLRYGDEAHLNILELQQLISQLKTVPEVEKLKKINDFFNQKINYAEDIDLWSQSDYWATPLEAIGREAGDCEDYSIAKYVFLKTLNVPNDKLRLTYVRAEINFDGIRTVRAHMVLSYYPSPQSEPMVLDSLVPEILPASSRKDLTPIFSFNDKGLWIGSSSKPKADAGTHLSKWRDVLTRMQADGIE